jgi:iron complex outermembrane receptor protein
MKKLIISSLSLAVLSLGAAVCSHAATELEVQVVTASKSQAKVEQMAVHTTIISQEEIKKSTAQTLDQLLNGVPGMNFSSVPSTQTDPTGQSTKMRGAGNARVLVLLDGIPLLDPFYSTTQFYKVQLSNIDHIEIVRGGNSSIWGNMAVAGVINIITKKAIDNSGQVDVSYGSYGSSNISLNKNFSDSKEFGINLLIDQLDSKGYPMFARGQEYKLPGAGPINATNTNIQLTSYFRPSNDLNGHLRLGYHIQDQQISYLNGNNTMTSPDVSGVLNKKLTNSSDLTISGWTQIVNLDKFNGAACYYLNSTTCKGGYPTQSNVTSPNQITNTIYQYLRQSDIQQQRETGGSALFSEKLRGLYLKDYQIGIDFRKISGTDDQSNYTIKATNITEASPTYLSSKINAAGEQLYTGIFAQARIMPDDKTTLSVSSRLDSFDGKVSDISRLYASNQNAALSSSGAAAVSNKKVSFNPSVGLRREVDDNLSVRAAAYKSFRGPGLNQTVRSYGNSIANPNLGLETLFGKEVGLDWNTEKASLSATYFYYDIRNMITTYKGMPTDGSAPQLVQDMCGGPALPNCTSSSTTFGTTDDHGIAKGLELSGKYVATPDITMGGWYTYTNTYMYWKGSSAISTPLGVQSVAVPKNKAGASVTYKFNPILNGTISANYIGKMYTDVTTTPNVYVEQGGNTIYSANVTFKYSKDADAYMNVVNLMNKYYSESDYTSDSPYKRTISPPRMVSVGARIRF